jgi:hypothetical protein
MGQAHCPGCQSEIPAEQINIAANVALCPNCGEVFHAADLLTKESSVPSQTTPPEGTRISIDKGPGQFFLRFPPTGFQWPLLFLIAFAIGWWSFLIAFVCMGSAQANWFMWFFMTPFFVAGLGMLFGIFYTIFGKTTVWFDGDECCYSATLFGLGRTRHATIDACLVRWCENGIDGKPRAERSAIAGANPACGTSPRILLSLGTWESALGSGYTLQEQQWVFGELFQEIKHRQRR